MAFIMRKSQIFGPETFLYFAYGGNMLTFRLQMTIPSAEFVSIGRIDNYRLDFTKYSSFWGGPTVTLVPTANAHVWGVIWRLNKEDLDDLDHHEELQYKNYYVKYVSVHTPYIGDFSCRTYILQINPLPCGDNDPIPVERWPSWTYKEILILGAIQHGLPEYYVRQLKRLKHNGQQGGFKTACLLLRYAKNEICECRVPGRIPRAPLKLDMNKKKYFAPQKGTFMYFAYGSNMWKKRIQLIVKSAKFLGIGRLDDHLLDFGNFSKAWMGAVATIVPIDREHVWGVVWRINNYERDALDKNSADDTKYIPRTVKVVTPEGFKVECLTYQQAERPVRIERGARVPRMRRPGSTYYKCMIEGATEAGLPKYYMDELRKIEHTEREAIPQLQIDSK